VLAGRFGSRWTYAGSLSDIGQLSARSLLNDYHFRSLTESTAVYGVAGGSVAHSVSPSMHNAAFRAARVDAVYLPFPRAAPTTFTASRARSASAAPASRFRSRSLFDYVDEVYSVARRIGAINTIRVDDGAGSAATPTRRLPGAAARARAARRPARRRCSAPAAPRARSPSRWPRAAARCGCTRATARRPREVAARRRRRRAVAARAGQLGSAGQLHADRHVSARRRDADRAEQLTGRYVYDLVYNPPRRACCASAAAAADDRGLEMLVGPAQSSFQWSGRPRRR
jgi:hypothetical protein